MPGVRKGSSDNLTSPIPHLLNADFLTAVARLTAGQVHYAGRDYYQRDTDTHYRLLALPKCFLADGTTPATQNGTWGTIEAHWVAQGMAVAQLAAVNNLTATAISNATPPSIDAVNVSLALKANTVTVQNNATAIAIIQKAIVVGSNVGSGNQAPVAVGGNGNSITGLESAGVAGGANSVSGNDSAAIAGYQTSVTGNASASAATGYSQVNGAGSFMGGGYGNYLNAENAAIIASRGATLPVGATYSVILGGSSFQAPVLTETAFVPQLYLFKSGGGVSFASPDGTTRSVLTLSNTGQLLVNGTALSAGAAGADSYAALSYAASISLDFSATNVQSLTLTAGTTFTTSANVSLLKTKEIYLSNTTAAAAPLGFPSGWTFFPGPAPTSLAAGKKAVLTLRSMGTDDSTVNAAYVAQA